MARTPSSRHYYHVTHANNVASIMATGIDPKYAVSPVRKAVWLVSLSKVPWAILHVLAKPRNRWATLGDIRVLEVRVHHGGTTRYAQATRYTQRVVPARKVVRVWEAREFGKAEEAA